MLAVLDANVVVALHIALSYSENAEKTVSEFSHVIAPELIVSEAANAFWKIARADQTQLLHARKSIAMISAFFDRLVPVETDIRSAFQLAIELGHPVYDCIYLALAVREKAVLVTADQKLARLCGLLELDVRLITS